jgi:hypothetical protein
MFGLSETRTIDIESAERGLKRKRKWKIIVASRRIAIAITPQTATDSSGE